MSGRRSSSTERGADESGHGLGRPRPGAPLGGERGLSGERGSAGAALPSVGVVAFVTHPLPELRTALRGIRETVPPDAQLAVVATGLGDQDATYLLRQYLRGRIHALDFEGVHGSHCGLDRAYQLVRGDYIVRVDDTLEFQSGWLARAISAFAADPTIGCLSLVPPADYHRGRGRPRTVHVEPVVVDRLDMSCFITPRELVERHECELMGEQPDGCRFQDYLRAQEAAARVPARPRQSARGRGGRH